MMPVKNTQVEEERRILSSVGYKRHATDPEVSTGPHRIIDSRVSICGRFVYTLTSDRPIAGHKSVIRSARLSHQQWAVMLLIVSGMGCTKIGEKLRISRATVDSHRRRIFEKTGLTSVAALAIAAEREGIVADQERNKHANRL